LNWKFQSKLLRYLCEIVNKISQDQSSIVEKKRLKYGLSSNELKIIELIGINKNPKMMKDIAKLMSMTKGGMTFLIDKLEEKKLVERNPDSKDRRVVYIKLTEHGKKIFQEFSSQKYDCIYKIFEGMDKNSKKLIKDKIDKIFGIAK